MVPVHLLVWAVVTFITTFTCLLAVWEWDDRTDEQKWTLTMMYGPYAAFGTFSSEFAGSGRCRNVRPGQCESVANRHV
jgi:hypothetical protein